MPAIGRPGVATGVINRFVTGALCSPPSEPQPSPMSSFRRFCARWRIAVPGVAAALLAGCATRYPASLAPVAPIASSVIWRIEPGDALKMRVFRNPELDADPNVTANGTAYFPGIGRIPVAGLSLDSLESVLNARYATLVRDPAVQVTMTRDLTLYGQIRTPGVYPAEPGATILSLIARAGGQAGSSGTPDVTLETADGRVLTLPREARLGTLDLHRTDAILFTESSFIVRHSGTIQASSVIATTISTLISLILIVSR